MYTKITTTRDLSNALRSVNKMDYTELGGYPIVFVTCDGELARPSSVLSEYKRCLQDFVVRPRERIIGMQVFWEGAPEQDVITGEMIDSAYGDPDLGEFVSAYVAAMLWSSTDDAGTPLDANYGPSDLAPETDAKVLAECSEFFARHSHLWGDKHEQAGHDFWLTRCRHGAGFWDRDCYTDATKELLTAAAHEAGEQWPYVGDDRQVYL